jgi:subtilase family serine protease
VPDATDFFLGARSVGVLATGVTSSGVTLVRIPAGAVPGSYHIVSKADWSDTISESLESNNTRAANIRIGPDLIETSVTGPSSAMAGSGFTASDAVTNQGADTVPVSTTRFYLSVNSSLDASDVPIGSRVVPALTAGASDSGPATLLIPAQTAAGKYYIVAAADADGLIAEALENNNTKARSITITAP